MGPGDLQRTLERKMKSSRGNGHSVTQSFERAEGRQPAETSEKEPPSLDTTMNDSFLLEVYPPPRILPAPISEFKRFECPTHEQDCVE